MGYAYPKTRCLGLASRKRQQKAQQQDSHPYLLYCVFHSIQGLFVSANKNTKSARIIRRIPPKKGSTLIPFPQESNRVPHH
ncbi:hypothetical protein EVA_08236 [gut metagenome]|uniref:Uncharacterized protein n=1 Tax=gut metagenome TaxID=749906 RepID=J9G8V0_9ZZZZ